jgi:hypothetical protein
MTIIHPAALAHARKRFLRADAHRFLRPDWRRFVAPGSELAALYESIEHKYRPDQLRVPAGTAEGGQWTSENVEDRSTGLSAYAQAVIDRVRRLAARGYSVGYLRCLDFCSPILERPQPPGVDLNQWEFFRCMDVCLGRNR